MKLSPFIPTVRLPMFLSSSTCFSPSSFIFLFFILQNSILRSCMYSLSQNFSALPTLWFLPFTFQRASNVLHSCSYSPVTPLYSALPRNYSPRKSATKTTVKWISSTLRPQSRVLSNLVFHSSLGHFRRHFSEFKIKCSRS